MDSSQSTRMVLHNLELLERIFQNLSESKRSLVSASLTAKSFSEPAFNVLWYEMESIWLLFRLLPIFNKRNGKYVFTGLIRNEHIQRVFYYAKRIRYLHYKDANLGVYADSPRDLITMTSTLMRVDKLGAFVPLRKIHLHGPLCNAILLPLTSPNLEGIEIRTERILPELTEIGVASFLQSFTQSPHLRSLTLEGPFKGIIIQVLPDFTNLHRLSIYLPNFDIPIHFIKRFASAMPSLRHLYVKISDSSPPRSNGMPQGLEQLSFPSLETLTVDCDPTYLENLLGVLDAPLLKSITLEFFQFSPDVGAITKFVERNQILKDKVHKLSLKHINTGYSLNFVRSFKKLNDLFLQSFSGTISMSDIVDAFSFDGPWLHSLTHLSLVQTAPRPSVNGISMAALSLIADACPNLKSLSISIHHPGKPEEQALEKEGREPRGLESLFFFNLPGIWDDTMSSAIAFVSFLVHLFPAMCHLEYLGGMSDKPGAFAARKAWWKGVEDMWRMCQSIKDVKKPLPA